MLQNRRLDAVLGFIAQRQVEMNSERALRATHGQDQVSKPDHRNAACAWRFRLYSLKSQMFLATWADTISTTMLSFLISLAVAQQALWDQRRRELTIRAEAVPYRCSV